MQRKKWKKGISPAVGVLLMVLLILGLAVVLYTFSIDFTRGKLTELDTFQESKNVRYETKNGDEPNESSSHANKHLQSVKEFFKRHPVYKAIASSVVIVSSTVVILKLFNRRASVAGK
jgi:FlaG/FlaF family flagellin (archaellin)